MGIFTLLEQTQKFPWIQNEIGHDVDRKSYPVNGLTKTEVKRVAMN